MQVTNFNPFTLVVDAWACDEYGDSPSYAEIAMTQALLAEIVRISRIAKDAQIRVAHIDSNDGIWGDPDGSLPLRMRGTGLVIMPSRGSLGESSFFWQGHPKHADYNCETRAIDLKDLLACIGNAGADLPNGFRRERDVLFCGADSGVIDELIEQYFDEDDQTDGNGAPTDWVIYHYAESPDARFWSEKDGWTSLAGATRYAEMPLSPYPMGGPENTQAGALCIGTMQPYTVMVAQSPMATAFAFECFAEDEGHAVEQALNAYPGFEVQSVCMTEADKEFAA